MNKHILTTICSIASAMIASAQVPSLINYQGRLTDADDVPITGIKEFALTIFDAETGGNVLYSEMVGPVTLDANGVYSFQFGSSGGSNTQVTETVATTNGTATTFQKILDMSPVADGSVSVTDGTYTWSQSAGSSNDDDFGVAYNAGLRRVTVNYFNGAPAAGREITVTYRYVTGGITGALSSGAEHWMAVSVDGTPQGVRQRVLAVPFAMGAKKAETSGHSSTADHATFADAATVNVSGYQAMSSDVTYQAPSSGFIIASRKDMRELPSNATLSIKVGSSPGSLVEVTSGNYMRETIGVQQTIPVKKGLYWRAEGFGSVFFVSFE